MCQGQEPFGRLKANLPVQQVEEGQDSYQTLAPWCLANLFLFAHQRNAGRVS